MGQAVILMYHRLSEALPEDRAEWIYTLSPARFVEQMDLLAERRARITHLAALDAGRVPDRSVLLTFDDGCETDASVALPILLQRSLRAAFFVNPGRVGRPGYLDWAGVAALHEAGMEIGSHGLDHTLLDGLSDAELERQLKVSKGALEARLGRPITALSLPGGSGGRRAERAARAFGYRLVLGSRPGRVSRTPTSGILPRYALRRGESLEGFRGLVEQRLGPLLAQGLRYRVAHLARAALGSDAYERTKRGYFGSRFNPSSPQKRPDGSN